MGIISDILCCKLDRPELNTTFGLILLFKNLQHEIPNSQLYSFVSYIESVAHSTVLAKLYFIFKNTYHP